MAQAWTPGIRSSAYVRLLLVQDQTVISTEVAVKGRRDIEVN
jgi:hypothetical protein